MAKSAKRTVREARPVGLVLDTCVWLDLAQQHTNEPLLAALEQLCRQHTVDLIVPQLVRDEFARNKERVIRDSGKSLSGALKRAQTAIWTYGDPKKRDKAAEVLRDIDHRLKGSIEIATDAIRRIEKLFTDAIWCHSNDKAILAASKRAMDKKAPFHHDKNSFADATLIELYGQMVSHPKNARYVFVTHNTRDFSAVGGDQRLPHPDIAGYFSKIKSRYFIKLVDALRAVRPREFMDAMYESEFSMEPRTHNAPLHRAVQRSGGIVAVPILSGLHHQYVRM
ncbi:MAG: PIN domain-containing protein [Bradyrhizobium sp.]